MCVLLAALLQTPLQPTHCSPSLASWFQQTLQVEQKKNLKPKAMYGSRMREKPAVLVFLGLHNLVCMFSSPLRFPANFLTLFSFTTKTTPLCV